MKAAFDNLRHNAKRRGKFFDLTFNQFKNFCYRTKYMKGKGRAADSYTVDCKVNEKGYTAGNLQVLSKQANSAKGKKVLFYDPQTRYARYI